MEEANIRTTEGDSTIIHIGQIMEIETIGRFDLSTKIESETVNAILVWVLDIDLSNVPTIMDSY